MPTFDGATLTFDADALSDFFQFPQHTPANTDVYGLELSQLRIKAIPVPEPGFAALLVGRENPLGG